jgi:hypothetical protein
MRTRGDEEGLERGGRVMVVQREGDKSEPENETRLVTRNASLSRDLDFTKSRFAISTTGQRNNNGTQTTISSKPNPSSHIHHAPYTYRHHGMKTLPRNRFPISRIYNVHD